jgi:uncharacterized protein YnzC (UPF0291/DUF896 family)
MVNTMSGLKTSESLLQALKRKTSRLTSDEILEQRISFVFGSINPTSDVTREQVRQVIRQQKGED